MQKQRESLAKAGGLTLSSTATATTDGIAPLPANNFSFPATTDRKSQQVPSTTLRFNPAYPSKQNPVVPSPAPNGFINHTVTVNIEYNNTGYVSMYQAYYEHLWFAVAGFGYTEAEALQDFLQAYHEEQVYALRNGRPIPILRFRFVRHKRNKK